MITVLQESHDDLVALSVDGQIRDEDYDTFLPLMEKKIESFGSINIFLEIDNVEGIDIKAVWKDLKFDARHLNDYKKIAVVGDENWEKTLTSISEVFTTAETRFFNKEGRTKALEWLN